MTLPDLIGAAVVAVAKAESIDGQELYGPLSEGEDI